MAREDWRCENSESYIYCSIDYKWMES